MAALSVCCLVLTSGAIVFRRMRTDATAQDAARQAPTAVAFTPDVVPEWRHGQFIMFESTTPDETYGKVAIAPLSEPGSRRYVTPLECVRVSFAAGRGMCLDVRNGPLPAYTVDIFDDAFQVHPGFHGTRLAGPPSRTRVSPDGRYAATTAFAAGDGYALASFSTRTVIVDLTNDSLLADLEQFTVFRDGAEFKSPDFNFWGVTFGSGPGRFFATLGTGGTTYLVEGDIPSRQATVLLAAVECPSLSPDGTRIAFKHRLDVSGRNVHWQIAILDIASLRWSPIDAETRSVDDQIEWLDDQHVMYGLPRGSGGFANADVWVVSIDGTDPPRIFVPQAWSPSVVR